MYDAEMNVILAEFNELSPALMGKFIVAGKLPDFKTLRDESQVDVTAAEDDPHLEAWIQWVTIQWVTVHAGVPFVDHGIEHLDTGHNLDRKNIWDVLSDAGRSVWVRGSMNVVYEPPINGWVLPDPWTTQVDPYPKTTLNSFVDSCPPTSQNTRVETCHFRVANKCGSSRSWPVTASRSPPCAVCSHNSGVSGAPTCTGNGPCCSIVCSSTSSAGTSASGGRSSRRSS